MARKDVEQFNLRLNLNNPNHLKIYRTFQDLNTDIHKSRNNFIIEALLRYINGISDVILCQEKVQIKNDFFPSCQHT